MRANTAGTRPCPGHPPQHQGREYGYLGFPGDGKDSDTLQQLRAVLPCEVRVTSATHPLSGRLVAARSFKRLRGDLLLVIELPDGSPGTIRADATDVLGAVEPDGLGTVLDVTGLRRLRTLVAALAAGGGETGEGGRRSRWPAGNGGGVFRRAGCGVCR